VAIVVIGTVAFSQQPEATQPLLEGGHEVRFTPLGPAAAEDRVIEALQGVAAVLAQTEPYTARVLEQLPELKLIARVGVGYDTVDVEAATARGIMVTATLGANDWAVADHAFGLMLALCHHIIESDQNARAARWLRPVGLDLWQKTLGLVGLGRIGKGMVQRAAGFQMKVLAHEPYPDLEFVRQHDVELVSLDQLMRRSDFISLHLPALPETHHIVDAEMLSLMKPTAYLVNTARGPLIDEAALEQALDQCRLAGAGLDVREVEPGDERFWRFPNVVLTTHTAGITVETVDAMACMASQSAADGLAGRRPHGLVNPEVWERRR
jgi:phosphoglycerate dehydrogenase-like enzyme